MPNFLRLRISLIRFSGGVEELARVLLFLLNHTRNRASCESKSPPSSEDAKTHTENGHPSGLLIRPHESRASVVLPGCARPPRGGPGFFRLRGLNPRCGRTCGFHIFHDFSCFGIRLDRFGYPNGYPLRPGHDPVAPAERRRRTALRGAGHVSARPHASRSTTASIVPGALPSSRLFTKTKARPFRASDCLTIACIPSRALSFGSWISRYGSKDFTASS